MTIRDLFLLIGILSIYIVLTGVVIFWIISTSQLNVPDKVLASIILGALWGLTMPNAIRLRKK